MKQMLAGVLLAAAGAALVAVGFAAVPETYDDVRRDGRPVPAEVVGVDGGEVRLRYTVARVVHEGVARPETGGPYVPGDFLNAIVLESDPERVVIDGAGEEASVAYAGWFVAGALLVIAGLGVMLFTYLRPGDGGLPRVRWIGERHGG